jgi:hypothetical protein
VRKRQKRQATFATTQPTVDVNQFTPIDGTTRTDPRIGASNAYAVGSLRKRGV